MKNTEADSSAWMNWLHGNLNLRFVETPKASFHQEDVNQMLDVASYRIVQVVTQMKSNRREAAIISGKDINFPARVYIEKK